MHRYILPVAVLLELALIFVVGTVVFLRDRVRVIVALPGSVVPTDEYVFYKSTRLQSSEYLNIKMNACVYSYRQIIQ